MFLFCNLEQGKFAARCPSLESNFSTVFFCENENCLQSSHTDLLVIRVDWSPVLMPVLTCLMEYAIFFFIFFHSETISVNDSLMELLITSYACKTSCARKIIGEIQIKLKYMKVILDF